MATTVPPASPEQLSESIEALQPDLPIGESPGRGPRAARRIALLVVLGGWGIFLAYSALQAAVLFTSGLGSAPKYGDTNEYWSSAGTLRVDDVRTWTYAALLRFAPGELESPTSIAFVQALQLLAALGAAAYFAWAVAKLLRLPSRWMLLAVASSIVVSGASFISIHFSQSILQDSLAASGWMIMVGSLLLLLPPHRTRPLPWLLAALPAGALVAGLRWERLYVALPLLALTAALVALPPRSARQQPFRRMKLMLLGLLAMVMVVVYGVTRYTLKIEGRELPGSSDVATRLLDAPVTVTKTFLENILSPVSTVISTKTDDVVAGLGAVPWTNSRMLDHVGYWPSFLWLTSALVVAIALLTALLLGLPGLLGRQAGRLPPWIVMGAAIAGVAALHAVTYRWFHPRYCLPITGIELSLAAILPVFLIRNWLTERTRPGEPLDPSADAPESTVDAAARPRHPGA